MSNDLSKIVAGIVGAGFVLALVFAVVAVLAFIMAWPFMWLWNYAVVSALTVAKPITYWPAFWLMLFTGMFISGNRVSASKD